jgi:HD-GYP domain-containing protein (c-di-GMP phosphodiesterase class II)
MPLKIKKISLVFVVFAILLIVGLVPLLMTSWLFSERSAKELRAAEGRYQTQLVQDKARQIEMFGQRYCDIVGNYAKALELTANADLLSSPQTHQQLKEILEENPNLLSFSVKPIVGEPLSVYKTDKIALQEVDEQSATVLVKLDEKRLSIGKPTHVKSSSQTVFAVASPVMIENQIVAAVVAIVSFDEISRIISEMNGMSERQLWDLGLPILFVVDEQSRIVFHPNQQYVLQQTFMNEVKIVEEWQESRRQIQSALVPFTLSRNNEESKMIGAYSTSNIKNDLVLGVIAMQREDKALASVGEMKTQTWIISLIFALLTLILGSIFARQLTKPILELVSAAKTIALGDLTTRILPKNIDEIDTLGSTFNSMSSSLEENISQLAFAATENRELFVGTVKALSAAIDGKDRYTRGHSERVSRISLAIGQRMNMAEDELEKLRISALLHDVGKIAIDDNILKKPSALTAEEFEIMKTHPKRGYKIMSQIPAMKDFLPGMYMHHEMLDGKGYPQGLTEHEIPLQAKIVSVADTFDAMTTDRPYQKGMELDVALGKIAGFVGTRYCPKVVKALEEACADGQIGLGVVRLKSVTGKSETVEFAKVA